jgi:hypothetical protein
MQEHHEDLGRIIVSYVHSHLYESSSSYSKTLENGKPLAEAKVGYLGTYLAVKV